MSRAMNARPYGAKRRSKRQIRLGLSLVGALLACLTASPAALAAGSVSLTATGVTVVQDFNTLANSGESSTVPDGVHLVEAGGGSRDNESYTADSGSSSTGDTYSYGSTGISERAFGGLQTGVLIPTIGMNFTNNTGATITHVAISYTGEQWRLGAADRGADRLDFQSSTDATSLTSGTWTSVDSLDFVSPITSGTVGARDGNLSANRTAVASTVTGLNVPSGGTFWIRWLDFNVALADDGLAVDDFSITANPASPVVANCGAPLSTPEGTAASQQVSATDADGTVADISITSIAPSDPGTITVGSKTPASSVGGTATANVVVGAATPPGTYTVTVTATNDDPTPQTGTCQLTVTVVAGSPPDCSGVGASPNVLSHAGGGRRFVLVTLSGASDPDLDPVSLTVTGVTQDEPLGDTTPDAATGSAADQVLLRAERDRQGDGRVYRIAFSASDGQGGSCTGTATVSVPLRKGVPAVDSGGSYDSFGL